MIRAVHPPVMNLASRGLAVRHVLAGHHKLHALGIKAFMKRAAVFGRMRKILLRAHVFGVQASSFAKTSIASKRRQTFFGARLVGQREDFGDHWLVTFGA